MALPEDLVEEFLLRFSPSEPSSLVRAALVCKPWCRLISSARFRRRFLEFHRTPPMLGFIRNTREGFGPYVARFVPTSSFRPSRADNRDCLAIDARHGRVLLRVRGMDSVNGNLIVWDPMTDESWHLPRLVLFPFGWNAAVLCAGAAGGACDHLCPRGRFLVVVSANLVHQVSLWVYSSEEGFWSEPIPAPQSNVDEMPTVLVGNILHFSIDTCRRILTYDLTTRETSVICLPPNSVEGATVLMAMEDGELGAATKEGSRLSLRSMERSSNGDIGWAQIRVIELEKLLLLQVKALSIVPTRIVFAPGTGIFLIHGDDGIYTIDLNSDQVKKVLDNDEKYDLSVVPFMSFYTPEFRASNR